MVVSVFKMFNVEEKIEELRAFLGRHGFLSLEGKHIAIATPVYDEGMRNIYMFDNPLYITQKNDADLLESFFLNNANPSKISVITTHCDASHVKEIDYLILLHEFTVAEEDNLVEELRLGGSEDFKVYRLY